MKRTTISLLATASLIVMTTACSGDNGEPADTAQAVFTVNLDGMDSRAISDGLTVDQLVFGVFDADGNEIARLRQSDIAVTGRTATLATRLQRGRSYTCVFWAQKSGNNCYDLTNLDDLVVSYTGTANNEQRDAFTASVTLTNVLEDFTQNVTLRRPFAQLDYVCSATEWQNLTNSNYSLAGADVTITAGAYTHLNLLTGEATQPTTTAFTLAEAPFVSTKSGNTITNPFTAANGDTYFWISMNYLLAGTDTTALTNATMNIYTVVSDNTRKPVAVSVDNLPVCRNHRTVVQVSDITRLVTAVVGIDPGFSGDL